MVYAGVTEHLRLPSPHVAEESYLDTWLPRSYPFSAVREYRQSIVVEGGLAPKLQATTRNSGLFRINLPLLASNPDFWCKAIEGYYCVLKPSFWHASLPLQNARAFSYLIQHHYI
jgi:hypothetical protein